MSFCASVKACITILWCNSARKDYIVTLWHSEVSASFGRAASNTQPMAHGNKTSKTFMYEHEQDEPSHLFAPV